MPAQLTISEHTRPAPNRRPWRLNACTLTPAIGASTRRVGTSTGPIRQGERRSICTGFGWYSEPLTSVRTRVYHSRPAAHVAPHLCSLQAVGGRVVKDVLLTPEGYEKLKQEIEFLRNDKRRELEERLVNARVIDTGDVDTSVVSLGSKVRLKDVDANETIEYHIVGSAEANPAEQKLSNESPVGKAIMGRKKGETVEVTTPRGSVVKFKIMEIKAAA